MIQNFVMDAKIDPKVVMDLSMFKIGGWNILQPSNRKLLEEFVDENEPWLLIRTPGRESFLMIQYLDGHSASSDQHMKELMQLRDGPRVTTQCSMRQHDACRHSASWRESMRKQIHERADMQMESSEDAIRIKWIHVENNGYFSKQLENQK